MSKVTNAQLRECITQALEERKKRKFVESIDLQIMLRDYNPEKEKRFNSTTVLSYPCRSKLSVCVIGVIAHIEQAKALNIEALSIDDIKKFNKESKLIKKWARKFDVLLVSESLSRNVTKLIGRHVTSIGKLPVPISEKETVEQKFNELLCTIRFRVKKNAWLAQSVGVDTLEMEQIRQNVNKSINFLASLLPKGWQNIRSITVKTTMGKPQKIYQFNFLYIVFNISRLLLFFQYLKIFNIKIQIYKKTFFNIQNFLIFVNLIWVLLRIVRNFKPNFRLIIFYFIYKPIIIYLIYIFIFLN